MKTIFINGGKVDKVSVSNDSRGIGNVTMRVTGDTKAKRALAELEIEITHMTGQSERIIKRIELKRGKTNCVGTVEISVPYIISNVRVLGGTVWRNC